MTGHVSTPSKPWWGSTCWGSGGLQFQKISHGQLVLEPVVDRRSGRSVNTRTRAVLVQKTNLSKCRQWTRTREHPHGADSTLMFKVDNDKGHISMMMNRDYELRGLEEPQGCSELFSHYNRVFPHWTAGFTSLQTERCSLVEPPSYNNGTHGLWSGSLVSRQWMISGRVHSHIKLPQMIHHWMITMWKCLITSSPLLNLLLLYILSSSNWYVTRVSV